VGEAWEMQAEIAGFLHPMILMRRTAICDRALDSDFSYTLTGG
jgi:hypothetical protein